METVVTILGARGSVPVSGSAYARYGGATTCVLLRFGADYIVLDAGTGLMSLPAAAQEQSALPLLLTHPHADHLLGLPLCPYAMKAGARLDIYAASRGGLDARAQVCRLLAPPLWPVGPDQLPADIRFHELPGTMTLGGVRVDAMEGRHPGGVSLLRLEADGTRVVFATDCTIDGALAPALREFARGCDLLLCDGQYTDEEWPDRAGFGHNSWSGALGFARSCGAKRLRVIHHDPFRTDAELDRAAERLRAADFDCDFAREGEVIRL